MVEFETGCIVTTHLNGGMTGEVIGAAVESDFTGNFYIVKILEREGLSADAVTVITATASKLAEGEEAKTWSNYPYSHVVLSETVLIRTPENILDTFRTLGIIPHKVRSSDFVLLRAEQEMRDAVKKLNIDDSHLRKFLEKAAKDYMKAFNIKGSIKEIYPLDFMVMINGYGHIRIPVKDFFEGKASFIERDLHQIDLLKGLSYGTVRLTKIDMEKSWSASHPIRKPKKVSKGSSTKKGK